MKSRDFCYWLQGFFELQNENVISARQVAQIRSHLAMVFKHEIDPSFGKDLPALQGLHPQPAVKTGDELRTTPLDYQRVARTRATDPLMCVTTAPLDYPQTLLNC